MSWDRLGSSSSFRTTSLSDHLGFMLMTQQATQHDPPADLPDWHHTRLRNHWMSVSFSVVSRGADQHGWRYLGYLLGRSESQPDLWSMVRTEQRRSGGVRLSSLPDPSRIAHLT
jgi:hypothetical protein